MMMNESGIEPVEYKCLVLPDVVEETTQGGIVLARSMQESEQMAEVKATLVAIGGMAGNDWAKDGQKLTSGVRVMIAKYAGLLCRGKDGKEYRLINDKDICAVIDF